MYFVVKETVEDKKQYEVFENIVSSVQVEDDSFNYGDKLITLSTCEYSQENGRLIVVAKKVK